MKNSKISNVLGMSALALSLAVLPATIGSAQNAAPGTGTGTTGDTTTTTTTGTDNADYNNEGRNGYWGLLGLLGLFGLLGRKSRDESTAYRDPGVTTETTGSRKY